MGPGEERDVEHSEVTAPGGAAQQTAARRVLRAPVTKALVLCLPLAFTTTLTSASQPVGWTVSGARTAGDSAWMDSLVGPVPTSPGTSPQATPGPGTPVTPLNGDPQVLVLPAPGALAPAGGVVPVGAGDTSATRAYTSSGIPVRTLQAYLAAAQITARLAPNCHLHWSLLAGIGRVETNHGRFGGATIGADGVVSPAILGPRLNGTNGFVFIRDQDDGRWDGDPHADRAMGPMQFIPGTWKMMASDADGDGRTNPQDVDDAALAAARYLCSGGTDVGTQQGRWRAVFRYNHSNSYVALVLGLADSYARGAASPLPSRPADLPPSDPGEPSASPTQPVPPSVTDPSTSPSPRPTPSATRTPAPSPTSTPTRRPTPSPTATPTPTGTPTPGPSGSPSPTGSPTPTDTPSATPSATTTPTASPTDTPTPSVTPSPDPSPACTPVPSPSPTPSATPTPTPSPSPTPSPTAGPVCPPGTAP